MGYYNPFSRLKLVGIVACLLLLCSFVRAQDQVPDEPADESSVESIYDKYDAEEEPLEIKSTPQPKKEAQEEIRRVSELKRLQSFEDIAVIQRRFLPKTGRFEAFGAGTWTLNDPFFNNLGVVLRLGYNFREKYAVELNYFRLFTTETQATKDLKEKKGVETTSFVTPVSYIGADFKWSPIYGKMTLLNKRIVPFDLYFSFGGGMTETDQTSGNATLHLGTGQIFAMTKAMAFRWDFSWNFYQAESRYDRGKRSDTYDNLFINIGMSWFFPEAKYR